MKAALAVFLALLVASASAQLTVEQKAKCEAEGGCLTMTREALLQALRQAHAEGHAVGAAQRCWRPA